MRAEVKQEWVEALRSGEYRQTKGMLHKYRGGYCCLGVLCELAAKAGVIPKPVHFDGAEDWDYAGNASMPPEEVYDWAGIEAGHGRGFVTSLANLNDQGTKFGKIADLIEASL